MFICDLYVASVWKCLSIVWFSSTFTLLSFSSECISHILYMWNRTGEGWGGVGRLLVEHRLCQCLTSDWRGRVVRSHSSVWGPYLFYHRHSSHTAADWPSTVMKDVIFMQQWLLHTIVPPTPSSHVSDSHLASMSVPTFVLSRCALSSNWCLLLQDRGSGHL